VWLRLKWLLWVMSHSTKSYFLFCVLFLYPFLSVLLLIIPVLFIIGGFSSSRSVSRVSLKWKINGVSTTTTHSNKKIKENNWFPLCLPLSRNIELLNSFLYIHHSLFNIFCFENQWGLYNNNHKNKNPNPLLIFYF
jgi:hypothetical protein